MNEINSLNLQIRILYDYFTYLFALNIFFKLTRIQFWATK